MVKLSANETKAIAAWLDSEVGFGFGFRIVHKRTGLASSSVRRTVRALARKGLVRLERMLWSDDGVPAGSGYVLTQEGRDWLDSKFGDIA